MSRRPPGKFSDVESFIRAHGVTRLPPAFAAPSSAALPDAARIVHAAREVVLFPIIDRRGRKHRQKRRRLKK